MRWYGGSWDRSITRGWSGFTPKKGCSCRGGARGDAEAPDRLSETHGLPQALALDNGPEFTSKALETWARRMQVKLYFITPGKPAENGYIESFNGKSRDECLNLHWFQDLADSRGMIEDWRTDYNRDQPHSSLGYLTPLEFKRDLHRNL